MPRLLIATMLASLVLACCLPGAAAVPQECGREIVHDGGSEAVGGICVNLSPGTQPQDIVAECVDLAWKARGLVLGALGSIV